MSGLTELIVATVFVFVVIVFMLVAAPTIDGVADAANTSDMPGNQSVGFDPGQKIEMVTFVSLVFVPTAAAVGFIIYAFAAIVMEENYQGRL